MYCWEVHYLQTLARCGSGEWVSRREVKNDVVFCNCGWVIMSNIVMLHAIFIMIFFSKLLYKN